MGIDIYMKWQGQTDEEADAQITGFSPYRGSIGYLREAYHGDPYATEVLVAEAFDEEVDYDAGGVLIPAATLRERLPATLATVEKRWRTLYSASPEEIAEAQASFTAFVELAERKEAETGEPVRIRASC